MIEREVRNHRPGLGTTEFELTAAGLDLDRPEQPDVELRLRAWFGLSPPVSHVADLVSAT